MDVHKNARSVPASRVLLYKRVSELGYTVREASEAAGISDRRCREWVRRAKRDKPLTDRNSRPHTTNAIHKERREHIRVLRRERRTMRQVAGIAGVSLSTVAPRTNGKVERMIQTLLREWAYRFAHESSAERKQWLQSFLHFYNCHRAHSSLGDNPPISRLDRNNVLKRSS